MNSAVGPIIGMILLGLIGGWIAGLALRRVARLAFIVVLLLIALQLIGYQLATLDLGAIATKTRGAAHSVSEHARAGPSFLFRVLSHNLPLTIGFLAGLIRGLRGK